MSSPTPLRFDAFLSYNSQDRTAVDEMARRLRAEGLTPYLEADELAPGREFQPGLAEALRTSKVCVMFLGPNGLGPWQKEELQVAIDKRVRDADFHVIPVLLPGAERPRRGEVAHLEFLINGSWVEFLKTLDDEKEFRRLIWGITGEKPPVDVATKDEGVCPYRGLEAFGPDDARFYFGRENLTDWLISDLRREIHTPRGIRLLAVLGPSGSGKSSLVLAGLIPRLRAGAIDGSEHWKVAIVRPGDDPLENLATEVASRCPLEGGGADVGQVRKLIQDLGADENGLHLYARLALHNEPDDVRLVVVVDQFEEVFTYQPQDEQAKARFVQRRESFLANLLDAAARPVGRVAVVLTMRSDFLGACAPFPRLNDALGAHLIQVGPMREGELREAIERPSYLVGCEVEPALTERMLADVAGQAGALPLLQFALTKAWKKREVRKLTLQAYDALGGIEGALEHRANEVFRSFTLEERDLCRQIFLRLVQPGEGTEDTKRRVSYRELLPDDPTRAAAVREVVQALADRDARLITTDRTGEADAVEVAHEALIRGWKELRGWIDADRAGLRTHRRLTESAQQWYDASSEARDDFLYTGARLAVASEWAKGRADNLSTIEKEFLKASQKAADDDMKKERRRSRRFLILASVASVLFVAAGGLGWWANLARKTAETAQTNAETARDEKDKALRIAESRRLAALSDSVRSQRLDVAMLLALEASREDTLEARGSLQRALNDRPEIDQFLYAPEGTVTSVAFDRQGRLTVGYQAIGFGRDGVVLFGADGARATKDPLAVKEGEVSSVAFDKDGRIAAGYSAGYSGGVVLFGADGARATKDPLAVKEGHVTSVAFDKDGRIAAGYSGGGGGRGVVLFDAEGRRIWSSPLAVKRGDVSSVAFDKDGRIAAGNKLANGNGVFLFDAEGRRVWPSPLAVKGNGYVTSAVFSGDGRLAVGYDDSSIGGVRVSGVMLLAVDLASWRRKAGEIANRNFTRKEWTRYLPETSYRRTIPSQPWPHDLPEAERK